MNVYVWYIRDNLCWDRGNTHTHCNNKFNNNHRRRGKQNIKSHGNRISWNIQLNDTTTKFWKESSCRHESNNVENRRKSLKKRNKNSTAFQCCSFDTWPMGFWTIKRWAVDISRLVVTNSETFVYLAIRKLVSFFISFLFHLSNNNIYRYLRCRRHYCFVVAIWSDCVQRPVPLVSYD